MVNVHPPQHTHSVMNAEALLHVAIEDLLAKRLLKLKAEPHSVSVSAGVKMITSRQTSFRKLLEDETHQLSRYRQSQVC